MNFHVKAGLAAALLLGTASSPAEALSEGTREIINAAAVRGPFSTRR